MEGAGSLGSLGVVGSCGPDPKEWGKPHLGGPLAGMVEGQTTRTDNSQQNEGKGLRALLQGAPEM